MPRLANAKNEENEIESDSLAPSTTRYHARQRDSPEGHVALSISASDCDCFRSHAHGSAMTTAHIGDTRMDSLVKLLVLGRGSAAEAPTLWTLAVLAVTVCIRDLVACR